MLLLRHGQSEFNVIYGKTRQDPGIRDPRLTVKGRAQANDAANQLTHFAADQIVSSPYRRTLETSSIIAAQLKLPITVTPLIAERAVFRCDIGSPTTQLRRDFPHIDFLNLNRVRELNVAGPRSSEESEAYAKTISFLQFLLPLLQRR